MSSCISRIILGVLTLVAIGLQPAVANAQPSCANAFVTKHDPSGAGTRAMWEPGSSKNWRVINFWTNWPGVDQTERKLSLLAPGQDVKLLGGGTVFEWPVQCESQAFDGFNSNPLKEVTPDQLGAQEWLCCDEVVFGQWDAYWSQTSAPAATQAQGCPPAQPKTVSSPTDVEISGGPAIVHPWWNNNKPPWGQTQTKVMFRPENRTIFIQMMGEYWLYENSAACNARLESELNNAPRLPTKSFDEYRTAGLIR